MKSIEIAIIADVARLGDGLIQAVHIHDADRKVMDMLFWVDRETNELQEVRAYRVGMFSETNR